VGGRMRISPSDAAAKCACRGGSTKLDRFS
jgi:hypothetical protein